MHLGKIATRNIRERMEAWDPVSESFVPDAFAGRVDLTDRFLSNFNKPLRRRMLFTDASTQLPGSHIIRHPVTKEVYLTGISRGDTLEALGHYINLTVLHMATDTPHGSSGLATIYRSVPLGPDSDPGWLVETALGRTYLDMEFRTSANEADTHEIKIENYYAYIPSTWDLEPWDFLELHGKRYRVVDTFADSGFSGLRVDREEDTRINFVLHTQGAKVYDKVAHRFVSAPASFNVTGNLAKLHDFSSWVNDTEDYIDVVIDKDHVGFRPEPNTMTLEWEGQKRLISQVSSQPGERQYRLRCR